MKIIAVNGSPRKDWNTAMLLGQVLEGAASKGMETEIVHLYDLEFKGCVSCFACKLLGSRTYGRCAMRDGLTPLLEAVADADALACGSPIYWSVETGLMRAFLERLWFQHVIYSNPPRSLRHRRIRTAFVYTMNVPEHMLQQMGYEAVFTRNRNIMDMVIGACENLVCTDTLQFADYSKYETGYFNPEAKQERRREVFPRDLEKAFELGARMAKPV